MMEVWWLEVMAGEMENVRMVSGGLLLFGGAHVEHVDSDLADVAGHLAVGPGRQYVIQPRHNCC